MSGSVEMVQNIYAAFGQGRIQDILDQLTDDVVWSQPGGPDIPWSGTTTGKTGVAAFFGRLDAAATIERFEPRDFFGSGDKVVVVGHWSGKSKTKGKPFNSDWVMTWQLKNGRVSHYQAFLDTHTLAQQF